MGRCTTLFSYIFIHLPFQIKTEAAFHALDEYMVYVDRYYDKLEAERLLRARTEVSLSFLLYRTHICEKRAGGLQLGTTFDDIKDRVRFRNQASTAVVV